MTHSKWRFRESWSRRSRGHRRLQGDTGAIFVYVEHRVPGAARRIGDGTGLVVARHIRAAGPRGEGRRGVGPDREVKVPGPTAHLELEVRGASRNQDAVQDFLADLAADPRHRGPARERDPEDVIQDSHRG